MNPSLMKRPSPKRMRNNVKLSVSVALRRVFYSPIVDKINKTCYNIDARFVE